MGGPRVVTHGPEDNGPAPRLVTEGPTDRVPLSRFPRVTEHPTFGTSLLPDEVSNFTETDNPESQMQRRVLGQIPGYVSGAAKIYPAIVLGGLRGATGQLASAAYLALSDHQLVEDIIFGVPSVQQLTLRKQRLIGDPQYLASEIERITSERRHNAATSRSGIPFQPATAEDVFSEVNSKLARQVQEEDALSRQDREGVDLANRILDHTPNVSRGSAAINLIREIASFAGPQALIVFGARVANDVRNAIRESNDPNVSAEDAADTWHKAMQGGVILHGIGQGIAERVRRTAGEETQINQQSQVDANAVAARLSNMRQAAEHSVPKEAIPFDEPRANLAATLREAHQNVRPDGVTVISGVDNPMQVLRPNPQVRQVMSERMAYSSRNKTVYLFGENNPNNTPENRESIRRTGFYPGQRVGYAGGEFSFLGELGRGQVRIQELGQEPQSLKARQQAAMTDLRALGYENPMNPREIVVNNDSAIELSPFDNGLSFSSIRSFEPGKGNAARTLDQILAIVDKYGLPLSGIAKKFGNKGMSSKKLLEWYTRHGFVENVRGTGHITREPIARVETPVQHSVRLKDLRLSGQNDNLTLSSVSQDAAFRLYERLKQSQPADMGPKEVDAIISSLGDILALPKAQYGALREYILGREAQRQPVIGTDTERQIDQMLRESLTSEELDNALREGSILVRQAKTEETGPVDVPEFITGENEPLTSLQRTGEDTVGAGFDRSLFKKLGANMYQGDLGVVALKEGIQNAVDSIPKESRGTVNIDYKNKSLIISDNGTGMTPHVMATALMDVGGSAKDSLTASGGYGLAKVALFSHAGEIHIESVAFDESLGMVKTTITGSGSDWVDGTLKIKTEAVNADEITGTTMKLLLPDHSIYQMQEFYNNVRRYSTVPFSFTGELTPSYSDVKAIKTVSEPLLSTKVPGADLVIRRSVTDMPSSAGGFPMAILNRGLYQFKNTIYVKGDSLPEALIVDVKPTVDINDSNYPFTTSRDQLKATVQGVLEDFIKGIKGAANLKEHKNIIEAVTNSPRIQGTHKRVLVDVPGETTPELATKIASHSSTAELANLAESVLEKMMRLHLYSKSALPDARFAGLGFNSRWLGMNLNMQALEARRVELLSSLSMLIGESFAGKPNNIYWNPYITIKETIDRFTDLLTPSEIAHKVSRSLWATMIHELAHQQQRGHDVPFTGSVDRISADLIEHAGSTIKRAEKIIQKVFSDKSFWELYREIRNSWSRNEQSLGILGKYGDATGAGTGDGNIISSNDKGQNAERPKGLSEDVSKPKDASGAPLQSSTKGRIVQDSQHPTLSSTPETSGRGARVENELDDNAASNALQVNKVGNGYDIRGPDGELIKHFTDANITYDFINQIQQPSGPELVSELNLPPAIIPPEVKKFLASNNDGPFVPYNYTSHGLMERVLTNMRRQIFEGQLRQFKDIAAMTKGNVDLESLAREMQDVFRLGDSLIHHERVKAKIPEMQEKERSLTRQRRDDTFRANETLSIKEAEDLATSAGVKYADALMELHDPAQPLDMHRIIEYTRFAGDLVDKAKAEKWDKPRLIAEMKKLLDSYDFSPNNQMATILVEGIRRQSKKKVDLQYVARLVDARMAPQEAMSRDEFMAKKDFNSVQRSIADQAKAILKYFANYNGMTSEQEVTQYMARYRNKPRLLDDHMISRKSSLEEIPPGIHNVEQMIRSGELSVYDTSPSKMLDRYIRSSVMNKHVKPIYDLKIQEMTKRINEIMDPDVKKLAKRSLNYFAEGLLRNLDVEDRVHNRLFKTIATELANSKYLPKSVKKSLLNASDRAITNLVNTSIYNMISAYQGGKIGNVPRDVFNAMQMANTWFGPRFALELLNRSFGTVKVTADGLDISTLRDIESGRTQGIIGQEFLHRKPPIPKDHRNPMVAAGELYNTFANAAISLSGQQPTHDLLSLGSYKIGYENALKTIERLRTEPNLTSDKKTSILDEELSIDMMSPEFQKRFDSLIKTGTESDIRSAAEAYGREVINKIMPPYGYGEQPRGWRTVPGRLFGLYGRYQIHIIDQLHDMASYGRTNRRKRAAIERFISSEVMRSGISRALGVDSQNWSALGLWQGSPQYQFATDIITAIRNEDQNKLAAALERIGASQIPMSSFVQIWNNSGSPEEALMRILTLIRPAK